METNITKQNLIAFEKWTVDVFNDGQLKSPVHLSGSINGVLEDYLIELFKEIKQEDWVITTYRSHYHALLKGVPEERLKHWILDNKSIHFMDKEYKMFSSAIVAGTLSNALGVALGIKMNGGINKVWCFIGDTTGHTGVFWECLKYAKFHDLPITFIIEDNGLSTDTPTNEVWGISNDVYYKILMSYFDNIKYIKYTRAYPHYGTGKFVAKIWENTDETKQKGF